MHNNQQIAANFSAYACEYQQQASLQRQIAQDLLKFINAKGVRISADDHLLDIGAGTGFIKQAIDENISHFTALDISEAMLAKHTEPCHRLIMDMDMLKEYDIMLKYDIIISSMALQWSNNPLKLIKLMLKNSKRAVAFTLLGQHTFKNWHQLMPDDYEQNMQYWHSNTIKQLFPTMLLQEQDYSLRFDDIFSAIKHIKHIGASGDIKASKLYELRKHKGVSFTLNYHIIHCLYTIDNEISYKLARKG